MTLPKLKIVLILIILFLILILVFIFGQDLKPQVARKPLSMSGEQLESYFNNKNEYEESFAKYTTMAKIHVLAATTSHHFLAKDLIAQTFSGIDPVGILSVIIVSPDHFKQIDKPGIYAQTTDTEWKTPFGNIKSDENTINQLLKDKQVALGVNLFRQEHGIYTLIPFIKRALPNSKIVPLVLKQSNNYQYFYGLGKKLSEISGLKNSLLVISSDYSHNVAVEKAKLNDQKSISQLPNKYLDDVKSITNDCLQCTAFLFGYLKNTDTDFKLIYNNNSFDLSHQNPEDVTSYVGSYFVAK